MILAAALLLQAPPVTFPQEAPWWAPFLVWVVWELIKLFREHIKSREASEDRSVIEAQVKAANVLSAKTLAQVARTTGSPIEAMIHETNRELDRVLDRVNAARKKQMPTEVIQDAKNTATAALEGEGRRESGAVAGDAAAPSDQVSV